MGATDPRNKIGTVIERENGAGVDHLITYTPGECGVATVPPVTVPEGHFYVLGDNRDHCTDSRRLGPIPREWLRAWGPEVTDYGMRECGVKDPNG